MSWGAECSTFEAAEEWAESAYREHKATVHWVDDVLYKAHFEVLNKSLNGDAEKAAAETAPETAQNARSGE